MRPEEKASLGHCLIFNVSFFYRKYSRQCCVSFMYIAVIQFLCVFICENICIYTYIHMYVCICD